jgi:hypothetical protein
MNRKARLLSQLPSSLDRKLNAYALAATAAGVGMLALTPPVEGKIIYTPKNVQISPGTTYQIDLNNDGITDVTISNSVRSSDALYAAPAAGNFLSDFGSDEGNYVLALKKGTRIAGRHKVGGPAIMAQFNCSGYWCNVTKRYMGVRLQINGKPHYGWARFNVSVANQITATLTGYAYETIPNKPIIAGKTKGPYDMSLEGPDPAVTNPIPDIPQPASLGALAMGTPGLSIWRRQESAGAAQ